MDKLESKNFYKYIFKIKVLITDELSIDFIKFRGVFVNNNTILNHELGYNHYELYLSGIVEEDYLDFSNLQRLKKIDLSLLDTGNLKTMKGMFMNCISLKYVDFGDINSTNVTNMSFMFMGCQSLDYIDLRKLKTENVVSMNGMFRHCLNLQSINIKSNTFKTPNLKDISDMFVYCRKLKFIDLSSFDGKNIINLCGLVYGCISLKTLLLFDVKELNIKTELMFYECKNLNNIGSLETINEKIIYEFNNRNKEIMLT